MDDASESGVYGAGRGGARRLVAGGEIGLHERTAATLQEELGDDGFERLAADGAAMTLEEVVDFALTTV